MQSSENRCIINSYAAETKQEIFMITIHCKPVEQVYYHGSTTNANIENLLLPPSDTGVISEVGRKKNLGRVFFTKDIGLAKIYAGRAARSYGGSPVLFRVVSPVNAECLSDAAGATVYHADWAFCESISI